MFTNVLKGGDNSKNATDDDYKSVMTKYKEKIGKTNSREKGLKKKKKKR